MASANLVLKVTPAEVNSKANEITTQRVNMQNLMNDMSGLVDRLSESWHSTSGDQYVGKYQHLKKEIADSLENLQVHIQHLQRAAQEYSDLENSQQQAVNSLTDQDIF